MAKQTVAVARDVRIRGKHVSAGEKITVDTDDPKDVDLIGHLLGSDAITETDNARLMAAPAPAAAADKSKAVAVPSTAKTPAA